MRIAQVAPVFESVPPKYYGGTERVVSYLTEKLVGQGDDVTLFASGDSVTKAHLVAACRRSLWLDKHCIDQPAHQILMLEHVFQRMIEAMGSGTLVIAYRGRAVPEVMEQCRTGFIVEGLEDAVDAVRRVPELSWKRCREVFERRFKGARMAHDYVQVYERLVNRKQSSALEVCT